MDWTQFAIFIFAMSSFFASLAGLFFWNRAEANADRREMYNIVKSIHNEIQMEIKAIHQEIKDFHGRLCKIEAERK